MSVVTNLENRIREFIGRLSQSQIYAFFSVLVFGLVAHGFVFFNRLSVHDNSHCLFTLGATYEVNRWGLGIIYKLQLLSTKTFSLPVFNGLLSMIFIACSAMILIRIFDIKSKLLSVMIAGMMVVFPMVTSSFSFMFTTWPYFMGLMFAFIAAYTITRELSLKNLIVSSIWFALSLSLYQAFMGALIVVLLLKMLVDVIDAQTESVIDYLKQGIAYLIELGLGLAIWAVVAKIFRTVKHIELETYKGWDEGYNLAKLPNKLLIALQSFFSFRMEGINALRYLRLITMVIFLFTIVIILLLLIKSHVRTSVKIASIVGIAFMPVAMVVVYLLSTSDAYKVSTMMLYPEVFVYLIPLILFEKMDDFNGIVATYLSQFVSAVILIFTIIVTLGYVYLDNAAYFKAAIYQEQAIAYSTALLANIKATPGFSDDMEIVIVGFNNIQDKTINELSTGKDELGGIKLERYYDTLEEMLNDGVNIQFLRDHIGIGNEILRIEDSNVDTTISDMPEVKEMPSYPNEGSIAIVDDMVVVKMGDALPNLR